MLYNLLVRPPYNALHLCFKRRHPRLISIGLIAMNLAVNLDDQTSLWRVEVGDELVEWMLPPKLETVKLGIA